MRIRCPYCGILNTWSANKTRVRCRKCHRASILVVQTDDPVETTSDRNVAAAIRRYACTGRMNGSCKNYSDSSWSDCFDGGDDD